MAGTPHLDTSAAGRLTPPLGPTSAVHGAAALTSPGAAAALQRPVLNLADASHIFLTRSDLDAAAARPREELCSWARGALVRVAAGGGAYRIREVFLAGDAAADAQGLPRTAPGAPPRLQLLQERDRPYSGEQVSNSAPTVAEWRAFLEELAASGRCLTRAHLTAVCRNLDREPPADVAAPWGAAHQGVPPASMRGAIPAPAPPAGPPPSRGYDDGYARDAPRGWDGHGRSGGGNHGSPGNHGGGGYSDDLRAELKRPRGGDDWGKRERSPGLAAADADRARRRADRFGLAATSGSVRVLAPLMRRHACSMLCADASLSLFAPVRLRTGWCLFRRARWARCWAPSTRR
jgi:hypothetical protein